MNKQIIAYFILKGKVPSKKNRMHISKFGGIYTDKAIEDYFNLIGYELNRQIKEQKLETITKFVSIDICFFSDNRSDLDNMVSTIFDLLQKFGVIKNDKLFVKLTASKIVQSSRDYKTFITIYTEYVNVFPQIQVLEKVGIT